MGSGAGRKMDGAWHHPFFFHEERNRRCIERIEGERIGGGVGSE